MSVRISRPVDGSRRKYKEWGPGNPLWESRVLGLFPKQSQDALISLAWLEAAQQRQPAAASTTEPVFAGLDVAGPGDAETVVVIRRGNDVVEIRSITADDARGEVLATLLPYQRQLQLVTVDGVGIGWYLFAHLGEVFPVQGVNVGIPAFDRERFVNLKAELYWSLRTRFESGDLGGLTDAKTRAQLASLRYRHNARGQVVIESKEEARKRGVKSPDRAEAMMLAFSPDMRIFGDDDDDEEDYRVHISPY